MVVTAAPPPAPGGGAAEYEAARRVLTDAAAASAARYPRGTMKFRTLEITRSGSDTFAGSHHRTAGTVEWDGPRARWTYREAESKGDGGAGAEIHDGLPLKHYVLLPRSYIAACPDEGWASVNAAPEGEPPPTGLLVRPVDMWWHEFMFMGPTTITDRLAGFRFADFPNDLAPTCEATLEGTSYEVKADVTDRGDHFRIRVVADLDDAPRLASYRASYPLWGSEWNTNYTWGRAAGGAVVPEVIDVRNVYYYEGRSAPTESLFRAELSDFRAGGPRSRSRFTLTGLNLPDGVRVTHRNLDGRPIREEWTGANPPPEPDRFAELAEELRAGSLAGGEGFDAEDRP